MKKIVIIVVALLFLASIYVGFRAAARLNLHLQDPGSSTNDSFPSDQQNFLLFHVSELAGESPFLISVWGLFVNYSTPPHLAFVLLYPSGGEESNSDNFPVFRLQRDATLPDRLIAQIERKYEISTDGYVLVDNFAVASIKAWLGQNSIKLPQQKPLSNQDFQSIMTSEQESLSGLCNQVGRNGLKPALDAIRWAELLPDHFSTSLTAETWLESVNTLTSAGNIDSCEVFIEQ